LIVAKADGFLLKGVSFARSHRLVRGINNKSLGIEVAEMAGMPRSVLDEAYATVKRLDGIAG